MIYIYKYGRIIQSCKNRQLIMDYARGKGISRIEVRRVTRADQMCGRTFEASLDIKFCDGATVQSHFRDFDVLVKWVEERMEQRGWDNAVVIVDKT